MNFKPMLSASLDGVDLSTLRYPLMLSPKLDGLRCILWEGVAYSRNAKPFRNHFVQKWASSFHNMDGEIIVGAPTGGLVLERSKAVTAFEGEPDFTFHMFDSIEGTYDNASWEDRFGHASEESAGEVGIEIVPHVVVTEPDAVTFWEERYLAQGYEGVMLRNPQGLYKHGRSTLKEHGLMKLKRFTDGEAVVVDLEEGSTNTNELQRDELGRAKRSFVKEGLVGNGMVGTLICKDPQWGVIRVAPGIMTHVDRQHYWSVYGDPNYDGLVGKAIHWRSFGYGAKDAPRHARFYGIKEDV